MSKILIKNGKALIIKNNDVVIEEINILIENGKIKKMEKNLEDSDYIINNISISNYNYSNKNGNISTGIIIDIYI